MKAIISGISVEGTPSEIKELIDLMELGEHALSETNEDSRFEKGDWVSYEGETYYVVDTKGTLVYLAELGAGMIATKVIPESVLRSAN